MTAPPPDARAPFRAGFHFVAAGLIGLAPGIIAIFRHSPPLILGIVIVALIAPIILLPGPAAFLRDTLKAVAKPIWAVVALLFAWLFVSTVRSPFPVQAFLTLLQFTLAVAGAMLLARLSFVYRDDRLAIWVCCGMILGAVLISIDAWSFRTSLPADVWRTKLAITTDRASDSNRAAVMLAICAPFALSMVERTDRSRIFGWVALVCSGIAILLAFSETAKLAVVAGAVTYGAIRIAGARAVFAASIISLFFIILMPVIAGVTKHVFPSKFYEITNPGTTAARADIWEAYASMVPKAPIFGHGLEATRAGVPVKDGAAASGELLNMHPHNAFLQLWIETGAVGVLLVVVLVAMLMHRIERLPSPERPAAGAFVVACLVVASVSHGAWQAWWPSVVGIALLAMPWRERFTGGALFPKPLSGTSGPEYRVLERKLEALVPRMVLLEYKPVILEPVAAADPGPAPSPTGEPETGGTSSSGGTRARKARAARSARSGT